MLTGSPDDLIEQLNQEYMRKHIELQKILDQQKVELPKTMSKTEETPWLVRIGWVAHLGPTTLSRAQLVEPNRLPEAHEINLPGLTRAVDGVIKNCNTHAQTLPIALRLRMNSTSSDNSQLNSTPLMFDLQEKTLRTYGTLCKRFLCHTVRHLESTTRQKEKPGGAPPAQRRSDAGVYDDPREFGPNGCVRGPAPGTGDSVPGVGVRAGDQSQPLSKPPHSLVGDGGTQGEKARFQDGRASLLPARKYPKWL